MRQTMTIRIAVMVVGLIAAASGSAALAVAPGVDNLRRGADVIAEAPSQSDEPDTVRGTSGGDVNGDGFPDILIGQGYYFPDASSRGLVYVVFGRRPMPERIDLADPKSDYGFVIKGPEQGAGAFEVASAGDVNGDGLDDVIVGAWGSDNNGRVDSGSAYVVFGKTDHLPVELALFDAGAQGELGYRIDGAAQESTTGMIVDGIGDMNVDGFDDVLIAAPNRGTSYVVWGKSDVVPVDLFEMHAKGSSQQIGFRIKTRPAPHYLLYSASGAGDVNADGVPDVVVGSHQCACVVFGKSDSLTVRVGDLGQAGFKIRGPATYWAVSGAGDVNADGKADIIVGAPHYTRLEHCCGKAYVVFGKRSSRVVRLENMRTRGFTIVARQERQGFGDSVGAAGDVNADGKDDLIVGATWSHSPTKDGRNAKGAAFVIYGKTGTRRIRIDRLGSRGFRMVGGRELDFAGFTVDGIGDLSGDGKSDVIVGSEASQAYVVFGR